MVSSHMGRLYNEDTGEFVHLSGAGITKDINDSWLGYRHQAAFLMAQTIYDLSAFRHYNRADFSSAGRLIKDAPMEGDGR